MAIIQLTLPGPVGVTVEDTGSGRPFLLLHGGAGPASVRPFAALLAARPARVLTPVHPGFDGTTRPDDLAGIPALARLYAALLDELDLTGVTVVGQSLGGWTAAELALLDSPRVTGVVVVDAVGLVVPGHPLADFFALDQAELLQRSFHDPARFQIDPATLSADRRALMSANRQAILAYGGREMADPTLRERLTGSAVPALVLWGLSDRIADPEHGRAYAAGLSAPFHPLAGAGHMPLLETPDRALAPIAEFAGS